MAATYSYARTFAILLHRIWRDAEQVRKPLFARWESGRG